MDKQGLKSRSMTVVDGLTVKVMPNERHEFLMTTKEVALGYGVSEYAIRKNKMSLGRELVEGKHFITAVQILNDADNSAVTNGNGGLQIPHNATLWTKRGVVRLGFAMRSERARMFRDWAEELVITIDERRDLFGEVIPAAEKVKQRAHNRLTKDRLVDILSDVAKIDDKAIRLSLVEKLTNFNS
ncbi:hypothetical protein [Tannerella forsythia]